MKDSGVEWIGEIPCDWNVVPIKSFLKKKKEILSEWTDENVLSLTMNGVVVRDLVNPKGKMPSTFNGYQKINKGNLILCLFDIDVTPRCVGVSFNDGVTSPAYSQYEIKFGNTKYYYYLLLALDNDKILLQYSRTLRSTLTDENFRAVKVAIIRNIEEQQKIADFLDEKTQMIDEIIADTKQSIVELKAYKQSIITEAVTKGLDSNVEMKDSGVEWIGEVPKGWNRAKVKQLVSTKITDGPHTTPELQDQGIPFVSAESVKNGIIDLNYKRGFISKDDHKKFSEKVAPQLDDIFMVKSGATTGNVGIVKTKAVFDVWSPLALIRVNKNLISVKFMYYYLQSNLFRKQVELNWSFGTQQNIGMGVIEQLLVWFPSAEEQSVIIDWLEQKCKQVDSLIKSKEQLISEYEDYKKSLIYEYVTGKKRVK